MGSVRNKTMKTTAEHRPVVDAAGNEALVALPVLKLADRMADAVKQAPEQDPRLGERVACSGISPDIFYPESSQGTKKAVAVCIGCYAMRGCLSYALKNNERFGVWGGVSERRRRRVRSALKLGKSPKQRG